MAAERSDKMPKEWKFSGKQDVYLEIAEYYESHILRGVLEVGDKLPSVRIAAGELGVNPNTVAKAYAHLESAGYIRALPKKGAYVIYVPTANSENEGATEKNEKEEISAETHNANDTATLLCRNTVIALKESGISREALIKLIEEVYDND